ncbi:MAG: hypothetical protein RL065_1209 [Bacteroidota bacterium]
MAQESLKEPLKSDSTFKTIFEAYNKFRPKISKTLVESTDAILFWKPELEIFRKKIQLREFENKHKFSMPIFLRDVKTKNIPKSKKCEDSISLSYDSQTKVYELVISDNFFVNEDIGCSEKSLIYRFIIIENRINIIEVLGAI